ncbi:MAG: cyclic nucleotide-binding domain-containing protein [Planctomycetes bacterium]|nr:cyclic nucleotide-binding domain-containing protein [Planctomycetota bacterium]MCH9727279.1 cyclic nucleotide-binding domain-containing protein [Planctomycetota bacterium]MCH9779137.1 cyclic nucleotide-binding domain-containing protein [Planctomycetota bacterium]MCH9792303.1 cyclic nucleotide-binding domain-containing protein [Planctomycetota bacterium]
MDVQQIQQILMKLRFTSGLSDEDQRNLARISHAQNFPKGATVFTVGSDHKDIYVIRSGRVEICMSIPARGCLPVLTLEAGDLVGWSSILKQGEMTATVIAVEDTQTIAIDAANLSELCEQDHDIGYQIMRRVATALSQRLVASRLQVLDMFGDVNSNNSQIGASE